MPHSWPMIIMLPWRDLAPPRSCTTKEISLTISQSKVVVLASKQLRTSPSSTTNNQVTSPLTHSIQCLNTVSQTVTDPCTQSLLRRTRAYLKLLMVCSNPKFHPQQCRSATFWKMAKRVTLRTKACRSNSKALERDIIHSLKYRRVLVRMWCLGGPRIRVLMRSSLWVRIRSILPIKRRMMEKGSIHLDKISWQADLLRQESQNQ